MKMFRFAALALAALLAFGLVSCGPAGAKATEVKIGFIGPLTGDYAQYGVTMSNAAALAFEQRNAAKAIDGVTFTLVKEDSEGKAEKSKAGIEKLASIDKVLGLVGDVFSSGSLAIRDTVEAEKIVMISPASSIKGLTEGFSYVFRTTGSDDLQAQVTGRFLVQELNVKNLAVLYTKNDYSQALAEGVKAVFEAAGGTVVAYEAGVQGDKDFKTQLTAIKATNPDAIYLPNYVAEIAQQLEQINQLGITAKLVSADGFSNPDVLALAGKYAEGVVFTANPQEAASDVAAKFAEEYTAKFGIAPDDFSKNAYDAANILVDAIVAAYAKADANGKHTLELDRAAIQAAVAATKDYQGASGKVSFDSNGDPIKNQGIFTVTGGAFVQTSIYAVDNGTLVKVQ